MAGLDTRGAFDGFAQGFGLMQGYQNSKDRKELMKGQQEMQQRGLDMREQEFSAQQDDRQSQKDQQQISQFYQGWASGIEAPVTPELEQVFERNKLADPRHLFKPETEAAVQYASRLAEGETDGDMFSDETIQHMNAFYGPRVNRGGGGKKRLAGMYPGQKEGSFVFEVEVEDEQGNKRLAPMTMNRGIAGEDDEVAQYDIEQAINPVMGARSIYESLGQNRDKMMSYLRSSGYLPQEDAKWEDVQGPDGAMLQRNTKTGEMKSVVGRKPVASAGGAGGLGNPTSQQKNYMFLRDTLNMTDEEAYQAAFGGTGAVNERVSGKVTAGLSLLNAQIKEIDSQIGGKHGLLLPDEDLAALTQEREALAEQRAALAQGAGLVPGKPNAQPDPKQPKPEQPSTQELQPGHVEGGFEFMGGDPADPASWKRQAPSRATPLKREDPVTTGSEVDQQMRDFKSQQRNGAPAGSNEVDQQIRELRLW